VKCLVFMGSSFRRRRKDVCGGLQLRGATLSRRALIAALRRSCIVLFGAIRNR
jgi:hypothetical protein